MFSKRGTTVLEAPEQGYVPEFVGASRAESAAARHRLRRDFSEDFAEDMADDVDLPPTRRRSGVKVKFRGGLPKTKWGRIAFGSALLIGIGVFVAGVLIARDMLLHDERFVIQSSSAIEFEGNSHATRAQLLNVFGEDIERNIFYIPLAQRRAELQGLPWVQHATVMRLLPNRIRVSVAERTPVAFVRQGNRIGLVDASGVLLDMPSDVQGSTHYSFPVVTGIAANDPLSTRAARMKIFEQFTADLDGSGEKISQGLSEVDLSNPEDVKALIPDGSSEVMVHFGDDDFLDRYRKFEAHLPEWRTQYPKLASVDMRYERQVVLEMQPGSGVPVTPAPAGSDAPSGSVTGEDGKVVAPDAIPAPIKAAMAKLNAPAHPVVKAHPATKSAGSKAKAPAHVAANGKDAPAATKRSDVAVWVHPKTTTPVKPAATGTSTAAPQYHPPQVVHP